LGSDAYNEPAPNTLLALNNDAKLPVDITGDANSIDGYEASDLLFKSVYDKDGDNKIDSDIIGSTPWSSITGMPAGFSDGV